MVNFAAADLDGLVRIVKRKLTKIRHRPRLIDGCLAGTGLTIEPGNGVQAGVCTAGQGVLATSFPRAS
ncbi:MAG TPA: hypothetical protein VGR98_02635 [Streptosporangiaceae bacterium]|nr:hypothetical protein [Streptosporangiaceae bacterium]